MWGNATAIAAAAMSALIIQNLPFFYVISPVNGVDMLFDSLTQKSALE
jgi:hypothetical protein